MASADVLSYPPAIREERGTGRCEMVIYNSCWCLIIHMASIPSRLEKRNPESDRGALREPWFDASAKQANPASRHAQPQIYQHTGTSR